LDNSNYIKMEDAEILELIGNLETIINERATERKAKAMAEILEIANKADIDIASLVPKKRGRPKKVKAVTNPK